MGVIPISGSVAFSHLLVGLRPSNERRVRADRSFCCCFGRPKSFRILRAALILSSAFCPLILLLTVQALLFHNVVNGLLIGHCLFDISTESQKLFMSGIGHLPGIGGV